MPTVFLTIAITNSLFGQGEYVSECLIVFSLNVLRSFNLQTLHRLQFFHRSS